MISPWNMATRKRTAITESAHYTNVILEEVRSQQKAMFEAITSMREEFTRTLNERFDAVELRLQALESAVRENSADIQKNSADIQKNSEDIRRLFEITSELRLEIRSLRADFEQREDRARIAALEDRLQKLEQRMGLH